MVKKEVGHHFLAKLGKKRLRPGGVTATNWLIEEGQFSSESQVLEVACNMCTTSIELAQKYHCQIRAVDMDSQVLEKAASNIKTAGLEDYIKLEKANAVKLPYSDNSFDIIINEAMLTMLRGEAKKRALKEYFRVLKPGGRLLTHDVAFTDLKMEPLLEQLSKTINANVEPLHVDQWQNLILEQGFTQTQAKYGPMTLMSLSGMIKDEGLFGTLKITYNGLKKDNRQQFLKMYHFFNKRGKDLSYIALCSTK